MNYSDFKNLDDFKVYLKKLAIEDIGKALDEIEKVVKINSDIFDMLLIKQRNYRTLSQQIKNNSISEENQNVKENRIIQSVFYTINHLERRGLKEDVLQHFFSKKTDEEDFVYNENSFDNLINFLKQQIADDKIEDALRDLGRLLRYRKQGNIILYKARFNTFKRERNLGLLTKEEEEQWSSRLKLNLTSFINDLGKRHFRKDIF